MKNPLKTLLIKIINYANKKARLQAARRAYTKQRDPDEWHFRQQLKLALGYSVTMANKSDKDESIIAEVKEIIAEARENEKKITTIGQILQVPEEKIVEEVRKVPQIEDTNSVLKEKNRELASEKEKVIVEVKQTLKNQKNQIEEQLADLNKEHVEAVKEKAAVEQTITNQEEK
jgi:hypothetical protein